MYAPSPAVSARAPVVAQPYGPLSATGFITPSYNSLSVRGNLANNAAAFRSPATPGIAWTPSYGLQARWNEAPQRNVADPLCRMLAYPTQCSLAKAASYTAYPDVPPSASMYPYGGNASVQLTDASPARLGNPGFFIPVSDVGDDAARAVGHPSTHVYGNVTSYAHFMTDLKDGPTSYDQACASRYICGTPVPSMVGYESSSADPMVVTCPSSYLKTVDDPTLVTLPPTRLAIEVANYPDPAPNALFSYAYPQQPSMTAFPPSVASEQPLPRRLAKIVNENILEPVQFIIDGTPCTVVGVSKSAYIPEPSHTVGVVRTSNNDTATVTAHSSVPALASTLQLRVEQHPAGLAYIASRRY